MQLCGAVIGWTMDKSSRKNVFQVTVRPSGQSHGACLQTLTGCFGFQITTSTGSELLLQVDNYSTALKWYDAIKTAIHASVSSASFPPLLSGCWFRLSSSPLCYRPEPTEVLLCGGPTAPSTCPGTAPYRDGALPPRAPSSGTRSTGAPSVSTSSRTSLQITAFNYSVKLQCLNCSVKLQQ